MKVELKIWRYDASTGERALKPYEVDVSEEATLLDTLDVVKDKVDGTLAYRKSCRMMICGSCGMRVDGGAVLACKVRILDLVADGRVPVDLGDGKPADRQGPRRRHGSVLAEDARRPAVPRAAARPGDGTRERRLAAEDGRDPQGVALHQLRLLRLRVQLDGVRPRLPRAGGAREGLPLRRRRARRRDDRAARALQRGARDLGLHPLLLLQRALPEGRRPARRDREARRGGDEGRHRPRHGREARQVVRHLGEDDRLAPRDRARAEDAGRREGDQGDQVRDVAPAEGQGAAAVPAARRGGRRRSPARCSTSSRRRAATAPPASSRARRP